MSIPAPKQPVSFCRFPAQLVIEAILLVVAGLLPAGEHPHPLGALLVLAALALPIFCFAKARAPEGDS
ncbi:MAG TPA: hypothetical protein VKA55_07955 [Gammaproteobacteria bacterium]|nr:hypothetical protein [Gammaproteobacteria bacterium]